MQKIETESAQEIKNHQKAKKDQILKSFGVSPKEARLITKAELDEQYPKETYERYSLSTIHKFRTDLMKAEGGSDELFKEATRGLESFVMEGDKKAIVFVRKKEGGE